MRQGIHLYIPLTLLLMLPCYLAYTKCLEHQDCELHEWVDWDCKNCCKANASPASAIRKRVICCPKGEQLDECLLNCNIAHDKVEKAGSCEIHCQQKCPNGFHFATTTTTKPKKTTAASTSSVPVKETITSTPGQQTGNQYQLSTKKGSEQETKLNTPKQQTEIRLQPSTKSGPVQETKVNTTRQQTGNQLQLGGNETTLNGSTLPPVGIKTVHPSSTDHHNTNMTTGQSVQCSIDDSGNITLKGTLLNVCFLVGGFLGGALATVLVYYLAKRRSHRVDGKKQSTTDTRSNRNRTTITEINSGTSQTRRVGINNLEF